MKNIQAGKQDNIERPISFNTQSLIDTYTVSVLNRWNTKRNEIFLKYVNKLHLFNYI